MFRVMQPVLLLLVVWLLQIDDCTSIDDRSFSKDSFILDGDTTVIVPDGSDPKHLSTGHDSIALSLALRDFELDWYKVLGYRTIYYSNEAWHPETQIADPKRLIVFVGDVSKHEYLVRSFNLTNRDCDIFKKSDDEAHCIVALDRGFYWNHRFYNSPALLLLGNHLRGCIYALYSFSELFLKVSPFYLFTDNQPLYQKEIQIAQNYKALYPPPKFKYRGFFLNDEELLGFFRSDPLGESVFDIKTFDDILQTLLRNKGNMLIPGTTPYPDENSVKLISRRGVVVSHSHFELLGFNAFSYDLVLGRSQWNWTSHADLMAHTWKAAIDCQIDYEVVWAVGLRGLQDYAYPCKSDRACGKVISEAVGNQTTWLQQASTARNDSTSLKTIYYTWSESLRYLDRGFLTLPDDTWLVLTDDGKGRISGSDADLRRSDGVYYHVAMLNGFSGQLTEYVSPERIFQQVTSFIDKSRSTSYFILNTSDLKPVVLSTSAVMQLLYDPERYKDGGSEAFLREWVAREYHVSDSRDVTAIAEWYRDYFRLSFIEQGKSDEFLAGQIGSVATAATKDLRNNSAISDSLLSQVTKDLTTFQGYYTESKVIYDRSLVLLHNRVPLERQQFFQSHAMIQSSLAYYAVTCYIQLAKAVVALSAKDPRSAKRRVTRALESLELLFQSQRDAEGQHQWKGLYYADRHRFTNFQGRRRQILHFQLAVNQQAAGFDNGDMQIECCQMEYHYQQLPSVLQNYPLFFYNPSQATLYFIHIECHGCDNNATGGSFSVDSTISMSFVNKHAPSDYSIWYTLDGSDVDESTYQVYIKPFQITGPCVIKARAALNDKLMGYQLEMKYSRVTSLNPKVSMKSELE